MQALLAIVTTVAGLHGFVTKGPTMPVCRVGVPCTAPAQVTLLFRNTRTARTFRTRSTPKGATASSSHRVPTPSPPSNGSGSPRPPPARRPRPHAHVDRLDFTIDTGIR